MSTLTSTVIPSVSNVHRLSFGNDKINSQTLNIHELNVHESRTKKTLTVVFWLWLQPNKEDNDHFTYTLSMNFYDFVDYIREAGGFEDETLNEVEDRYFGQMSEVDQFGYASMMLLERQEEGRLRFAKA